MLESIGIGALVWFVAGAVIALFFGKLASRCNRKEDDMFSEYRKQTRGNR